MKNKGNYFVTLLTQKNPPPHSVTPLNGLSTLPPGQFWASSPHPPCPYPLNNYGYFNLMVWELFFKGSCPKLQWKKVAKTIFWMFSTDPSMKMNQIACKSTPVLFTNIYFKEKK